MVKKSPQSSIKQSIDANPYDDETQTMHIVDSAGYPVLTFDAEDYRHYVEDMKLTKQQEDDLLNALWSIVMGFIDLGFGIETENILIKKKKENLAR